jgi:hypothetical protein
MEPLDFSLMSVERLPGFPPGQWFVVQGHSRDAIVSFSGQIEFLQLISNAVQRENFAAVPAAAMFQSKRLKQWHAA